MNWIILAVILALLYSVHQTTYLKLLPNVHNYHSRFNKIINANNYTLSTNIIAIAILICKPMAYCCT